MRPPGSELAGSYSAVPRASRPSAGPDWAGGGCGGARRAASSASGCVPLTGKGAGGGRRRRLPGEDRDPGGAVDYVDHRGAAGGEPHQAVEVARLGPPVLEAPGWGGERYGERPGQAVPPGGEIGRVAPRGPALNPSEDDSAVTRRRMRRDPAPGKFIHFHPNQSIPGHAILITPCGRTSP